MKILVVGGGGREHAICWKLSKEANVDKIYCAPGNAGILNVAQCIDIQDSDIENLLKFAKENKIDLTIVGPEIPLVAGIVDKFEKEGLKIFGPNKKCAQLEGSKAFSKDFKIRHNLPTAKYKEYTDLDEAISEIDYNAEFENALYLAQKRYDRVKNEDPKKAYAKIANHLAYKGFNYDIIKSVLNKIFKNDYNDC